MLVNWDKVELELMFAETKVTFALRYSRSRSIELVHKMISEAHQHLRKAAEELGYVRGERIGK